MTIFQIAALLIIAIIVLCVGIKKKKMIILGILSGMAVITIVCTSYVTIGSARREKNVSEYLHTKGYSDSEIRSIEVQHSFLNIVLGYQEWNVMVEFEDEPTVFYHYGFNENAEVSQGGISGGSSDKEKEDFRHIER